MEKSLFTFFPSSVLMLQMLSWLVFTWIWIRFVSHCICLIHENPTSQLRRICSHADIFTCLSFFLPLVCLSNVNGLPHCTGLVRVNYTKVDDKKWWQLVCKFLLIQIWRIWLRLINVYTTYHNSILNMYQPLWCKVSLYIWLINIIQVSDRVFFKPFLSIQLYLCKYHFFKLCFSVERQIIELYSLLL